MALALDFLQQIVNVHWKEDEGAVFVAGGYTEFVLYSKINKKEDVTNGTVTFTNLGHLDAFTIYGDEPASFRPFANVTAGAYKLIGTKPTFILGGNDIVHNPATLTFGSGAVITVSHDGQTWTKAFRKQWEGHSDNQGAVFHFAIDGTSIYGNAGSVEYYYIHPAGHPVLQSKSYERLLLSSNGESWAEAGQDLRYDSGVGWPNIPPPNLTPPSLFSPHINETANLPDGRFAYHETKDEDGNIIESYLAVPEKFDHDLSSAMVLDRYGPNIKITILKDEETITSIKPTPVKYVTCVARASEILMVGGTSSDLAQIAASIDDGATWPFVWTADSPFHQAINTISAAPLSDLKPPEPTPDASL